MIKKTNLKLILLILITPLVILGILLEPSKDPPSQARYIINDLGQFLVIFLSVLIGIDGIKFFSLKSTMGKALLFISLGILSWGIGALMWLYYNLVAKIEVPYPSIADVCFLITIPLVAAGLFLILRNIKIRFDTATIAKLFILPLIVLVICYFFFVQSKLSEEVEPLIKILNVLYPLGDIIFLSFALVILSLTFGSVLFKPLSVLSLGFILEAAADFSFSYTTTLGTYYIGSWVDVLFILAFFTVGVGMYLIHSAHSNFILSK